jgi:hypothetical protein
MAMIAITTSNSIRVKRDIFGFASMSIIWLQSKKKVRQPQQYGACP